MLIVLLFSLAVPYAVALLSDPTDAKAAITRTLLAALLPSAIFLLYCRARLVELGLSSASKSSVRTSATGSSLAICPPYQESNETSDLTFARCLLSPSIFTDRIREVVTPLTRALEVTSVHTVTPISAEGFFYPVLFHQKGILVDALDVMVNHTAAPVLSQTASSALAISAIDKLASDGGADIERYCGEIRPALFDLVSSPIVESTVADLEALKLRLSNYVPDDAFRTTIELLLDHLTFNYSHVVWIPQGGTSALVEEKHRFIQDLITPPVREVIKTRDVGPFVALLRAIAGTTPAAFVHYLANAARCRSYHLELFGVPGTYLSRQTFQSLRPSSDTASFTATDLDLHGPNRHADYRRFRRRRGQRYLHLYIRGGTPQINLDHLRVQAGFFERPPGSIGAAAVASFASTVLIVAGGAVVSSGKNPRGDLLAVLLAFPFVAGSIVGLSLGSGPIGGVMLARVGGYATACLSTIAAISALGYARVYAFSGYVLFGSTGGWIALTGASILVSVVLAGAWAFRSMTYGSFLRRVEQSRDDTGGQVFDLVD
ncbi:hypothetical protein LG324_17015 [Phycicoccus jejuensis]|uniref:hypothetical protein n=1 Tax=Phycicoccus jejuensis TaxID=367299 RepID=UPI00384A55DE